MLRIADVVAVVATLVVVATANGGIPKELLRKLKASGSFHDFLDDVHVIYHPEHTNRHVYKNLPPTAQPIRLQQASFSRVDSSSRARAEADIDEHTYDHLHMFKEIRQGNDTCKLQSVCVPIPVTNDDPQIVIYPRCYEVSQCVGSCCDSVETCHPHTVHLVEHPIIEMLYIGNHRFMVNATRNITMEEHTSCSCYDCGSRTPQCKPGFIVGRNCKCECANKDERNNCIGQQTWNNDECRCECRLQCGPQQHFNARRCECHRRHLFRGHSHGNGEGRTSTRGHALPKADIDDLPKLRVAHIGA